MHPVSFIQDLLSDFKEAAIASQVTENDFVIFVVGPTGAGKSWLVKELTKSDDVQACKTNLQVSTAAVQAFRCRFRGIGLNNVVFVDTPSFHTGLEGVDAEGITTAWIRSRFNKRCRRSVVLFLHNLVSDPTDSDMLMPHHLETFAMTFPGGFVVPSRVYVLPTREPYVTLPDKRVMGRLLQLESITTAWNRLKWHAPSWNHLKWYASMFPGVFAGQPETAWSVVLQILMDMGALPDEIITPWRTGSVYNFPDRCPIVKNPAGPIPKQSKKGTNNPDETIQAKRAALQIAPLGHPRRQSALVNLANFLYEQFGKKGKEEDLEEVVALKRAAFELIPLNAPVRVAALDELTNLLSERFCMDGELDQIVTLHRASLELVPPGHPDRRSALIDLADVLFERFKKEGMKADLDEIIMLRRAAIELTPFGCQDDYATLTNFTDFLCKRFNKGEWNVELDKVIALRRDLLELTPPGHPQRRSALISLADLLSQRFEKEGMKADLDLTISLKRAALELTPLEDPDRYSALMGLANLLAQRFGKAAPLDEIVTLRRAALDLIPEGNSERCTALVGLADLLSERFRKVGAKADIDESIHLQQAALECIPLKSPWRRSIVVRLCDNLYQRFKRDGAMLDLAEVITLQRVVLELTPKNPDHLSALANLVDRLSDRFRIEGKGDDLDEMITLQQAALKSIPSDHPDYGLTLINLAGLLSQRFSREKMKPDLDLIISLRRTALERTPLDAADRHSSLNHLVDLLCGRFREDGAKEDLDEIISLTRALLECTPSRDPGRRSILLKFASYLSERLRKEGASEDLTEIILTQRAALGVTPPDHPDRCATLANLADCFSERFKREGNKADLDEIITLRQAALDHIPSGDARQRSMLVSLSDCTYKRFRREGSMADLAQTITLQRAVLELTGPGHTDHCSALISCAASLSERFMKEGAIADLNEIIRLRKAALDRIAQDDPQRQQIVAQLEDGIYERFKRGGAMIDLEQIIALRRGALQCTPPADQCRHLLKLASCLHDKFQKLGSATDIEEAIELGQHALALCPPGHPDRTLSQDCLTKYLAAKIRKRGHRLLVAGTGTSSSDRHQIKQLIRSIVFETLENIPLRLLHTSTGVLCNRDAQLSHFEASLQYSQLLSSISALDGQPREAKIREAVSNFFQYVMLSHRWGSSEPLLREIEGTKVYNLGGTDGLAKLQEFCLRALSRGFTWAWSDTCCIDKDSSAELQEAIGSMFLWYRRSSLTLVYLSDVPDGRSLADSVWFKRGWTLQELLASPTILFYTQEWSLCMNRKVENHKTDPTTLAELEKATGIAEWHLTNFYPGMDDARSRLQWASGRRTTRPEDVAYSLFGIFKLHLPTLYGESVETALGRLLGEIISRSGDISVLDWVGEASTIHSCFPANLTPYQTLPCAPPIPSDATRRDGLELEKARKLCNSLARLPRARFVNQRLTLPSIAHWVTTIKPLGRSTSPSCCMYEIHASHLQPLKIMPSVSLETCSSAYVLVRPWHPKSLEGQMDNDVDAPWKLLEQLEQPFNALLLRRLPHNEYERIASDCEIVARVQDLDSILASEVLVPEIV
ncbi:hypothetical protein EDC04DRAFT_3143182 [Pisolithus marmoratus]|nr:hypothetical protein EDC04DRAFT_3143182 [Pisolithus marmoratus]